MVEATIRPVRQNLPVEIVTATRGKVVRAELIVAFYEQGRLHYVRALPELEDQLCTWAHGTRSPDRRDALLWAVTDLSTRYQSQPAQLIPFSIYARKGVVMTASMNRPGSLFRTNYPLMMRLTAVR